MRKKILMFLLVVSSAFVSFSYAIDQNEAYANKVMVVLENRLNELAPNQFIQKKLWWSFLQQVNWFIENKKSIWVSVHPSLLYVQKKLQLKVSPVVNGWAETVVEILDGIMSHQQIIEEVLRLVNIERVKYWVKPLQLNPKLTLTAQKHARYIVDNDDFSHDEKRSNWSCCIVLSDRYDDVWYDRRNAAENIAIGQETAAEVMTRWFNSQWHKDNILDPDFEEIWIAYEASKNVWVQNFGTEF